MSFKDDLKHYISKANFTITNLQKELNKRNNTDYTSQNLNNKINRETLKYTEVLELAEIMGYEVRWIKKNQSNFSDASDAKKDTDNNNLVMKQSSQYHTANDYEQKMKEGLDYITKQAKKADLLHDNLMENVNFIYQVIEQLKINSKDVDDLWNKMKQNKNTNNNDTNK